MSLQAMGIARRTSESLVAYLQRATGAFGAKHIGAADAFVIDCLVMGVMQSHSMKKICAGNAIRLASRHGVIQ